MWSRFLKISAHERCPKAAKPDKVRELSGIRSFRSFSDYLIHLRTASHHLKPRCERFTLDPSELEEYNSLQAPPMVPSMARGCTREQSNQRRFDAEKHKLRKWLFQTIRMRFGSDADTTLIDILEHLYANTTCEMEGDVLFDTTSGVRQGGPESPWLYTLFADFVMRCFLLR